MSSSGRYMSEHDYRSVTRHVSGMCDNSGLQTVDVILSAGQVERLLRLIHQTPEMVERVSNDSGTAGGQVSRGRGSAGDPDGTAAAFYIQPSGSGLYPAALPKSVAMMTPVPYFGSASSNSDSTAASPAAVPAIKDTELTVVDMFQVCFHQIKQPLYVSFCSKPCTNFSLLPTHSFAFSSWGV